MIILGAGMAGLIAANYFRKNNVTVLEKQTSLPNNHEALLRFRTPKIGEITSLPFKSVDVIKSIYANKTFLDQSNIHVANQYSLKVIGRIINRSIWDLSPGTRYIAPANFIAKLASGCSIQYGKNVNLNDIVKFAESEPIISTIPMNIMMDIVGWKHKPEFNYKPIWVVAGDITSPLVDVYQTIYCPDLDSKIYRMSITGSHFMIEFMSDPGDMPDCINYVMEMLSIFGIPAPLLFPSNIIKKYQAYGKIIPIDDDLRKDFIMMMSNEYGMYSLGRFATWRQLLLDDLVNDIKIIEKLVNAQGRANEYYAALHNAYTRKDF